MKTMGLPPGSLVYTGDKESEKVAIELIQYDVRNIEEIRSTHIEECRKYLERSEDIGTSK
jgi:hypothetical protein